MIELQDAAYNYGGGALLQGMTTTLSPGSFQFLTGPSGAGKSTFLKLCHGELIPTSGQISLFGKSSQSMDRNDIARTRRRIGVVHQDCQFLDHLTLSENIALPLTVSGRDTASSAEDLRELMAWVGLSDRVDARPPSLSGGERQRAALARAVIHAPDIVLADEPTGNVDWDMSQRLLSLLVELNKMGKTILIATHDLQLIRAAKSQANARVLRIHDQTIQNAGADL